MATRSETLDRLAARMPLVHFPASEPLSQWSTWGAFRSPRLRKLQRPPGWFDRLEHDHVFLYAGPACFASKAGGLGDSAAYFGPDVDAHLDGRVARFDTGACRPAGVLRPYALMGASACQGAIKRYSVGISVWRERFRQWLDRCYGTTSPERYLQTTTGNPHADGEPDCTSPWQIGLQNGTRGASPCADRRAWTWEVRSKGEVAFSLIAKLHVSSAALQDALRFTSEVEVIDPRGWTGPRALYEDSERVLREMTS